MSLPQRCVNSTIKSARFSLLLALCWLVSGVNSFYEPAAHAAQVAPLNGQVVYGRDTASKRGLSSPAAILTRLRSANQIPDGVVAGIKVVQSATTLNAATDGKSIVVTSGLLEKLSSDDEQAFVIAHELSHILLNHIGKTQFRRMGLSLLDTVLVQRFAQQNQLLQMAGAFGVDLADKRGSRGYEYQADDLGVQLMTKASFDPRAALGVFQVLKTAAGNHRTPEFLMDHPITDGRIRALVAKYKLS